ncbi:MAG: NUDIX hydrolase [Bacillota bacterium]
MGQGRVRRGRAVRSEKRLETTDIYRGRIVNLRVDRVRLPGGRETSREVVEHRGAVVILAVDRDGRVAFVRQYRHPVGGALIELPAGTLEEGEEPAAAAARELAEEIGLAPRRLERLGDFYSAPGFCDERLHLFLATRLTPAEAEPDEDERIEVLWATPSEAARWAGEGRIRDAKTLAGLHFLALRGSMVDAARYATTVPYLVLALLERHEGVWERLKDYADQVEHRHKPRRSNLNREDHSHRPHRPSRGRPNRRMLTFLFRNASKQLKLGAEANPRDRRFLDAARVLDLAQMELRRLGSKGARAEAERLLDPAFVTELEEVLWVPTRGDLPAPAPLLRRPYDREPDQGRLFDLP